MQRRHIVDVFAVDSVRVKLAKEQHHVPLHLVLGAPVHSCVDRSRARVDRESGANVHLGRAGNLDPRGGLTTVQGRPVPVGTPDVHGNDLLELYQLGQDSAGGQRSAR